MARGRSQMIVAPEFRRVVRGLPEAMRKRVYSGAAAAGAQVIRKEALANLGDLADRKAVITQKQRKSRVGAIVSYAIAVPKERWWLVFREFGRGPVTPKKAEVLAMEIDGETVFAKSAAALPAKPFLRPAFDSHSRLALDKVAERLIKGLARETKKLVGSFAKSGLGRRRRRRRRR